MLAQAQTVHFLSRRFEFIHQFQHKPSRVGRFDAADARGLEALVALFAHSIRGGSERAAHA